jgi:hypothetical protein
VSYFFCENGVSFAEVNMALLEAEPIQDLGETNEALKETNEALKSRLGRLIVEAASKHDPGLQSLIDEAIEVLGSNPLSDPQQSSADGSSPSIRP